MESRDTWERRLDEAASRENVNNGFHLLYGPWSVIGQTSLAFVSGNPGRRTADGRDRMVSDERGNSYEVEAGTTLSPITAQFLKMCGFLKCSPSQVLTGTSNPFRTNAERDLTPGQRSVGRELARRFWSDVLALGTLRRIVVSSDSARDLVVEVTKAKARDEFPSGWGNTSIRTYGFDDGDIIHLPQLSRYKLFSRAECVDPLKKAFAQ